MPNVVTEFFNSSCFRAHQTYDGWIFCATRKFAPNGLLRIGQILADPFQPEFALMPLGPLPIPEGVVQDVTEDLNVSLSSGRRLNKMSQLWAEAESILSADIDANSGFSNTVSWHFDSLKTTHITPPHGYVQKSLEYGEVPAHIKTLHFKKHVFMVTGITIAKGARLTRKTTQAGSVHGGVTVGPSEVGSMGIGGAAGITSSTSDEETTGRSSDFVFEYQVHQVYCRGVAHKPFRRGEVQSLGESDGKEAPVFHANDMVDAIVVDEIAEEPFRYEESDVENGIGEDGNV